MSKFNAREYLKGNYKKEDEKKQNTAFNPRDYLKRSEYDNSIGFDTLETNINTLAKTIQSVYDGWQTEETLNNTRSSIEALQKRVNAYQEYRKTYGTKDSADLTELSNNYTKILGEWDKIKTDYSKYKNADDYKKAVEYQEGKKTADILYLDKEISSLEKILKTANSKKANPNITTSPKEDADRERKSNKALDEYLKSVGYASVEDIQKALDEKKFYRDDAKAIQDKIWLDNKEKKMETSEDGKKGYQKYLDDTAKIKADAETKEKAEREGYNWFEKLMADYGGKIGGSGSSEGEVIAQVINDKRKDTSYALPKDDWTDAERNIFGDYYLNEGMEAAMDYGAKLNNTKAIEKENKAKAGISDSATSGFWAGAGHTLGSIFTAPLGLADYLDDLTDRAAGRNVIVEEADITPFEYSQTVSGAITTDLNEWSGTLPDSVPIIGGKGVGDIYGLGTSILQSTASAYSLGSFGTLISYFGQGAAAGVDDALSRGATPDEALLYGTILGAAEGVSEQIGVDQLLKIGSPKDMLKLFKNSKKGFWQAVNKQGWAEGLEEGFSGVAGKVADNFVMGDKSEFNQMVKELRNQGVSLDEAKKKAWVQSVSDIAYDVLGGYVSGGVHAAPHLGVQMAKEKKQDTKIGANIRNNEQIGGMLGIAELSQEESNAYDLYTHYAKNGVNAENISDLQLGRLHSMADADAQSTLNSRKSTAEEKASAKNTLYDLAIIKQNRSAQNLGKDAIKELYGNEEGTTALIEEGLESGENTESHKLAIELKAKVDAGETITEVELANLADANTDAYKGEVKADAEARLTKLGETNATKLAQIVAKKTNGELLTTAERETLQKSKNATRVYNEINNEDLVSTTENMSEGEANLILSTYDDSISVDSFMNSYNLVKSYATNRFTDDYVLEHRGKLTPSQASAIYTHFVTDEDAKTQKMFDDLKVKHRNSPFQFGSFNDSVIDYNNSGAEGKVNWNDLNDDQKKAIAIVGTISQQAGMDIELVLDGEERGFNGAFEISGNKIIIDVYAGMKKALGTNMDNLILPTLSHEITHWMKEKAPELYRKYEAYVFETLMQDGKTEERILAERRRLMEKAHPGTQYTDAQVRDEVIARASEDMLAKSETIQSFVDTLSADEKKTFIQKIKDILRDIKKWFNSYLERVKSTAPEAKVIREASERIDEQIKMWDAMLKSAIETNQALQNEGVSVADFIQKDAALHELQFNERLIEKHKDMIANNYSEDAEIDLDTLMARYNKVIDIWQELGGELNSQFLEEWNNKEGKDRAFTIFKKQSGYKYNVELSSMCKKGIALFEAIDTIVKQEVMRQLNTKTLGKAEKEILYDILKQNYEIPCAICYVEQARQREGDVIDAFLNGKIEKTKTGKVTTYKLGWNETLANVQAEMKKMGVDYTFPALDRSVATDNYTPADISMDEATQEAFFGALKKIANAEIRRYNKEAKKNRPLITKTDAKSINETFKGQIPLNLRVFKTMFTEPSSRFTIADDLLYSSMTTLNLANNHSGLYGVFNQQGGVGGYKTKQGAMVYWGDILKKSWKPSTLRDEGGVRNQSNSDFMMYTLLDHAQMYVDFTAKGYYLQAYTKVLAELKLFGLSKGKINASLIPKVVEFKNADGSVDIEKTRENAGLDEQGNPIYDDLEGINHTEAFMLLEDAEYSKSIGGVCIGYSDKHILKLLDDNRIQLIIGFHDKTNDPTKRYRGAVYAKNYNEVNEAAKYDSKGELKTVHIGFNQFVRKAENKFKTKDTINYKGKTYNKNDIPRLAADLYLEHCENKGFLPAYSRGETDFSKHPNYYKLLADFSLYDINGNYAPHEKVEYNMPDQVPFLDKNGNKAYMPTKDYIKKELKKELSVRDSLSEALADKSENGVIPQFVKKVNELYSKDTQFADRDTVDSLGNKLSEGQMEYFKDSKVRDEKGRLIPVYHGSKSAGFTEFTKSDEIGYFFARTIKTSKTYAGGSKAIYAPDKNSPEFSGAANYKVYLDIKKPYIIDGNGANWNQLEANGERVDISIKSQKWNNGSGIAKIQFKYGGKTYSQTVRTSEEFESFISKHTNPEMAKAFAYAMGQAVDKNGKGEFNAGFIWDFKNSVQGDTKNTRDIVRKAYNSHWNYDGVIFKNVVDSGDGSKIKADDLYVVFDSNQIKSVNNTNPTENKDIRYADRDTAYMDAVESGDMETAQRMVEEVARANGYDSPLLYHGTKRFGFTKIETVGVEESMLWSPFFTTNKIDTAQTYSGATSTRSVAEKYEVYSVDDLLTDFVYEVNRTAGVYNFMPYDTSDFDGVIERVERGEVDFITEGMFNEVIFDIEQSLYENSAYYDESLDEETFFDRDEMLDFSKAVRELWEGLKSVAEKGDAESGNYQFYANTSNFLVVDGNNSFWNRIPLGNIEEEFNKWKEEEGIKRVKTRDIAEFALSKGYSGVKIENIWDDGGRSEKSVSEPADVYIFFNPQEQVKSADPVTYDDKGKVIPLSQRFNKANDDIRYADRDTIDDLTLDDLMNLSDEAFYKLYDNLGLEDWLLEDSDVEELSGGEVSIDDISEKLNIEPKKIEILIRRNGLGTSHIEENHTAVMTQKRIDQGIKDSGAKFHPTYARRLITKISPKDFIDLTVLQKNVDREKFDANVEGDSGSTMKTFNYEGALKNSATPYLCIDTSTGQIIGHNGRHRIRALEMAGIESVEIEVELYDEDGDIIKYNAETIPDMAISSQFDTAIETHISNIIPLNEAHRDEIEKAYGEKAHQTAGVQYADRDIVEMAKIAEEHFGVTNDAKESGYITINGKMLDFSGRHWGGINSGSRQVDHEDVKEILPDDFDTFAITHKGDVNRNGMAKWEFEKYGFIRTQPETGSVELAMLPTEQQSESLVRFFKKMRALGKDILRVDINNIDKNGKLYPVASLKYNRGTSVEMIPLDIAEYYNRGNLPDGVKEYSQSIQRGWMFADRDEVDVYELMGENERLVNENERFAADIERLKERLKIERQVTHGNYFNENQINAVAGHLRNIANTTYDKVELMKQLRDLYSYIAHSEELNWEDVFSKSYAIAKDMLAERKDDIIVNDYFKDMLKDFRTTPISFNENQIGDAQYLFGKNYNRFLFNKFKVTKDGKSLDQVWKENWAPKYGFDTDISDTEIVNEMYKKYEEAKQGAEIVAEYNEEETARWLANEIYNQYWNVSPIRTTADKYDKRIKQLNAEHRNAMRDLRDNYNNRIAEQKKADREKYQERYKKLAQDIRERKDKEIAEVKKLGQERMAKYKENAERKTKIQSITSNSLTLNKWLTTNSKDYHIHENMKAPVIALLQAIDFSSKRMLDKNYPTKQDVYLSKALSKVKDMMADATNLKEGLESLYGHDMDEELKALVESVDNTMRTVGDNEYVLNRMSLEELKTLDKLVRTIKHTVTKLNKFHTVHHNKGIVNLAHTFMAYGDKLGKIKKQDGRIAKHLKFRNCTPYYYFKRLGEAGELLFEAFQDGWDKLAFNSKQIIDFTNEVYTDKEVQEWTKKTEEFTFDINGESRTFEMSIAQIMALHCVAKQEDAKRHLLSGGMTLSRLDKKGNVVADYENIPLGVNEINSILARLEKWEGAKEVADKLQEFMNTVCSDWGNEISMARFGVNMFGMPDYFPIKVSPTTIPTDNTKEFDNASLFRLLNMSFTKSRNEYANQSIEIGDIFDIFAQHTTDMAKYNALALPVLDFNKFYSIKGKDDITNAEYGVDRTLRTVYGNEAVSYVKRFVRDINGSQNVSRDAIGKTFFKNAKVAAVAANLRVVLLQPTAFFKASAVLDNKYLLKAGAYMKVNPISMKDKYKKAIAKAEKYCGIAQWKALGYYDTDISKGIAEKVKHLETFKDKAIEKSLKGAELADKLTFGTLWTACEFEIRDTRKDLEVGSEEFNQAIAKRLREVIYATQVVDSTMTRTDMMRSSDTFDKMLTTFGSEPAIAYNMLMDMVMQYSQDKKTLGKEEAKKKNGKKIRKVIAAYTITNVVAALVESGFDAYRDDDDDEEMLEQFMVNYLKNFSLDMSIGNKLPYIKEAYSVLQGYSSSRMDTQWMEYVYGTLTANNFEKFLKNGLKLGSNITGFAFYNLYRDLMATLYNLDILDKEDIEDLFS